MAQENKTKTKTNNKPNKTQATKPKQQQNLQTNQNNRSLLLQSGLMIVIRNKSDNLLPRKP